MLCMRDTARIKPSLYGDIYLQWRVIALNPFDFFCRHNATIAAVQRQVVHVQPTREIATPYSKLL